MITERRTRNVIRLALAAVVLAVFTHTRADPDLWGHVRFGGDMVAARLVRVADHYSFTSDRPWINHEWLAECAMYGAYAAAGGAGLVLLKVALLLTMLSAVIWTCRAAALAPVWHDLLVGLVVFATVPQANHMRPQLFSLALFAWLLALLAASARGRLRLVWFAVPLMALWANVHGGWLVGMAALGAWAALTATAGSPVRERVVLAGIAAAAFGATIANPYGWRLWSFLGETVGLGRADISEWQPMTRAGYPVAIMWAIVASAAIAAAVHAVRSRQQDLRAFAVVTILAVMSFRVNRLLAFFAIAVVVLMGSHLAAALASLAASRAERKATPRLATAVALAIGIALFAGAATASVNNAQCVRMDLDILPDPEVAAAVSARALHGRMLTWFDWGEYAIWHFSPDVAVSIDGRRETAYSDAVIHQHLVFYFVPGERQAIVRALRPDYIWLPRHLEVADRLQADGWAPVIAGSRSVLLARSGASATPSRPEMRAARCFPGP